jgi:hypothetical protein
VIDGSDVLSSRPQTRIPSVRLLRLQRGSLRVLFETLLPWLRFLKAPCAPEDLLSMPAQGWTGLARFGAPPGTIFPSDRSTARCEV